MIYSKTVLICSHLHQALQAAHVSHHFQDTTKRGCTIQESRKRSKTSLETVDKMLRDAFRDEGKKEKTFDTDVSFAESIVPLLRALPPRKNRLAKIEIQQVLIKYEFDE